MNNFRLQYDNHKSVFDFFKFHNPNTSVTIDTYTFPLSVLNQSFLKVSLKIANEEKQQEMLNILKSQGVVVRTFDTSKEEIILIIFQQVNEFSQELIGRKASVQDAKAIRKIGKMFDVKNHVEQEHFAYLV